MQQVRYRILELRDSRKRFFRYSFHLAKNICKNMCMYSRDVCVKILYCICIYSQKSVFLHNIIEVRNQSARHRSIMTYALCNPVNAKISPIYFYLFIYSFECPCGKLESIPAVLVQPFLQRRSDRVSTLNKIPPICRYECC